MNEKDAKILLTGILNDDDATVSKIISAYFEAAFKKELAASTKTLMESIGNRSNPI